MVSYEFPIFGDDGFRSKFGEGFMSKESISIFSKGIGRYLNQKKFFLPVIIGRDTRNSGKTIENIIASTLTLYGIDVVLTGILPTPGLSKLLSLNNYACGIMITASHNPASDNGIKLFNSSGVKLEIHEEKLIEYEIRNIEVSDPIIKRGKIIKMNNASSLYINSFIKNYKISFNQNFLIDCSNGAMSNVTFKLFNKHKNFKLINNNPNGKNINSDCGALETKKLLQELESHSSCYGAAFDGDGDRCVFVMKDYGVIEPDKLFYLLAKNISTNKYQESVVSSNIINLGIIKLFEKNFKNIFLTNVGDRNVSEKVVSSKSIIGMEPSGHFHFPKESKTMDGMITLLNFLSIIQNDNFNIKEELEGIKMYSRIVKNIPINRNKNEIELLKSLNDISTSSDERLLARVSIWDPLLRIYYDYKKKNNFDNYFKIINKKILEI